MVLYIFFYLEILFFVAFNCCLKEYKDIARRPCLVGNVVVIVLIAHALIVVLIDVLIDVLIVL